MSPDKYSLANLKTLHPLIRAKVIELYLPFSDRIRITCGLRSPKDQEKAFQEGKSKAHFGESFHNYGFALDSCVLLPGGKVDFDVDKYSFYKDFIDLLKLEGFSYSGDWPKTGFQEKGHCEYNVIPIAKLQKMQKDADGYVIL